MKRRDMARFLLKRMGGKQTGGKIALPVAIDANHMPGDREEKIGGPRETIGEVLW